MLKTILAIVIGTLISTMLLSALGFMEPYDIDKDIEDNKSTTAVTTLEPEASATSADLDSDIGGELPGVDEATQTVACPENTDGPDISEITEAEETTATVTEAPQIDYGWGEQPGAE